VSSARSRAAQTLAAAQSQAHATLESAFETAAAAQAQAGETLAQAGDALEALRLQLQRGAAVVVSRALAPEWLHLPGIETAYRVNHDSAWAAAKSVFALHADTVNIWTHLVTALYFCAAAVRVRAELARAGASGGDSAAFGLYLAFATLQMAMSVGYHTLRVVSPAHDETWLKLDMLGIAAQIVGAAVLGLREAFFCTPHVWVAYVATMVLLVGGLVALPFVPGVQTKEWDGLRNAAACAPVAFGLLPCTHWALAAAGTMRFSMAIVRAMLAIIAGYGGGFAIFFFGFPERLVRRKGLFDLIGHSHQLWHLAVSAAGACWLEGMLEHAVWRNEQGAALFCAAAATAGAPG
jgi:adiponectin receptor